DDQAGELLELRVGISGRQVLDVEVGNAELVGPGVSRHLALETVRGDDRGDRRDQLEVVEVVVQHAHDRRRERRTDVDGGNGDAGDRVVKLDALRVEVALTDENP